MKNNKRFLLIGTLSLILGLGSFLNTKNNTQLAKAETNQVINDITACKRITGNNSKTFIRFACNDVVGSYQVSYTGNVYDSNGNALPLVLYQNGGAGSADWVNGGTRLFELKTDSSDFINAIGSGTSFYITNESVFVNGDTSISFNKQYEFTSIYDGNFKYQELTASNVSFVIKEVETRLSGTRYRIGVDNLTGLSAGFNDVFKGQVRDLDGDNIDVEITDGHVGSTSSGYRRLYIDLASQAKDNTFFINTNLEFYDSLGMKKLTFDRTYRIANTTLSFCDGTDNHIYGTPVDNGDSIDQECIVCGHIASTSIYKIKLGSSDKYCQATVSGSQTEILIKVGGCSNYDTSSIPNVFRGTVKLDGIDTSIKITVTDIIVRFYLYLTNDHSAVKTGVISIDEATRFKSDDNQLMSLFNGVNIKYNTETNKYRIDPISYSLKESSIDNVVNKNWVSVNNDEVVISYIDVTLSNGFECLTSALTYRGQAVVDEVTKYIPITLQKVEGKNKLAFIFTGNTTGKLEISKDSIFELDTDGTYFISENNAPDIINFTKDLEFNYDADNNLVNSTNTVLSLSGVGAWSQSLDSISYNVMCSFDDCSISGISQDNSEIHPETLEHRGYHFYGKGYSKDNEKEVVDVDIWISSFKNTDDALDTAVVKTAIYTKVASSTNKTGIKLHKDDIFICSAYNLTLKLDDDYLVKWYVNSSRTTAGKYNNDKVGPTINVDMNNLPTYIEGDEKPTLPVSVNDDVDDVVPVRAQIWEAGALDNNNRLVKGTWKVTLTATDSSGNEAIPVIITITVLEKEIDNPGEEEKEPTKGCAGSISSMGILISILSIFGISLTAKKKKDI